MHASTSRRSSAGKTSGARITTADPTACSVGKGLVEFVIDGTRIAAATASASGR
jgi:hypothetical protein